MRCAPTVWGHAPLLAARLREQLTKPDDPFAARPPTSPGAALNNVGHQRRFSDPGLAGVAPNVDTLYTLAWLDLADEPFVLEAPDFGSRYYTFQFGLADTTTELSLGARTHGARLPAIVITGPGAPTEALPPDLLNVTSTTRYLLIAGRILVRPDRAGRLRGGLRAPVANQAETAVPVPGGRGRREPGSRAAPARRGR